MAPVVQLGLRQVAAVVARLAPGPRRGRLADLGGTRPRRGTDRRGTRPARVRRSPRSPPATGCGPGIAVGGIAYGILGAGAVFGPGIVGFAVHAILLEIGFVVGAMLLWQMRALVAERERREATWQQATDRRARADRPRDPRPGRALAERHPAAHHRRPARAARRRRPVPPSADDAVGEADSALADAEQVGRRAMTDIRRTVSAMADGAGSRQSLPGAADIAALVREVDQAGLHVEYDERGDLTAARRRHRARPLPDRAGVARQRRQARARQHRPGVADASGAGAHGSSSATSSTGPAAGGPTSSGPGWPACTPAPRSSARP